MSRFFRAPSAIYSAVRAGLDLAFGHPYEHQASDGTRVRTVTCLTPVEELPQDAQGRVVIALSQFDCERAEVALVLSELLSAGSIEEVSDAEYFAAQSIGEA